MELYWYVEVRRVDDDLISFNRVSLEAKDEREAYIVGAKMMNLANATDTTGHASGAFENDWVFPVEPFTGAVAFTVSDPGKPSTARRGHVYPEPKRPKKTNQLKKRRSARGHSRQSKRRNRTDSGRAAAASSR